ncbi:MAG: oxidoreductase [Elusimicrobiota bacterium]
MEQKGRKALITGASGLVGGHALGLLLADPGCSQVASLGRRTLELKDPKLRQAVVDFDKLELAGPFDCDEAFCCLGTTIRKAGSQEAFRKIDFEATLAFARLAKRSGATRFYLVSSTGADARSRVFYSRVKGEIEAALHAVGFDTLVILRPSLLLGERSESRPLERFASAILPRLSFLFQGPLRSYRPIKAEVVARAMVHAAAQGLGSQNLDSERIEELAARRAR